AVEVLEVVAPPRLTLAEARFGEPRLDRRGALEATPGHSEIAHPHVEAAQRELVAGAVGRHLGGALEPARGLPARVDAVPVQVLEGTLVQRFGRDRVRAGGPRQGP